MNSLLASVKESIKALEDLDPELPAVGDIDLDLEELYSVLNAVETALNMVEESSVDAASIRASGREVGVEGVAMSKYTDEQRGEVLDYLRSELNTDAVTMIHELFGERFGSSCQRHCVVIFLDHIEAYKRERDRLLDQCYYYLSIRGLVKQQSRLNDAQKRELRIITSHLPKGQAGVIEDVFGETGHSIRSYANEFPEKTVHAQCFYRMLENLQSDEFRRFKASVIASNKVSSPSEQLKSTTVAACVDPPPPLPPTPEKCSQGVSNNMYWCQSDRDGYYVSYHTDQRRKEEWPLTKKGLDQEIARLKAKRDSIGLGKSCPLNSLCDWLKSPVGTVGYKF